MNRLHIQGLAVTFICAAGISSGPVHAQTAKDLVGAWQVVSVSNVAADGSKSNPFGASPVGMTVFTPDGHFVQLLSRNDVPKFASNNRAQGTADENRAAVQGSIAIAGTYSIHDKMLTMKTEVSSYPNWRGTEQLRHLARYSHDSMTWTLTGSIGGQTETVWRRVR